MPETGFVRDHRTEKIDHASAVVACPPYWKGQINKQYGATGKTGFKMQKSKGDHI